MRFFHLSDLHLGKQLHYYSLLENQRAILKQIVQRVIEYRPDAVLICGDIFDKSVPSGEATLLLDEFLNDLARIRPQVTVLLIAGNHDSPQRLSYAKAFLEQQQIVIAAQPPRTEEEHLKWVELADDWGRVRFFLMPFLKPGYIRHLFDEGEITDYHSAVAKLLEREGLEREHLRPDTRNVLLSHQFYVNGSNRPVICDSEQRSFQVGGLDCVDVSLVAHFDYVALGHIHGPQQVKEAHIRYCGTPLKYSVSEEKHEKSITLVTLEEKGTPVQIETIPLTPLQEVRREQGLLEEILKRATPENCHDFLSVTLQDELEPHHPREQLEECYDYLLELRVDNQRTRRLLLEEDGGEPGQNPLEVFAGFYQELRGQTMSEAEQAWVKKLLEEEIV